MATLTLSDEQIIDLVRRLPMERKQNVLTALAQTPEQVARFVTQLPIEGKRAALDALSLERDAWWAAMHVEGEQQMRRLALNVDWTGML